MTNQRRDPYKGRQMYPKDTVTHKQLDRKVDRVETRLDHHLARVRRLTEDVRLLQSQMSRLVALGSELLRRGKEEEE